jgi:hypothetical protein
VSLVPANAVAAAVKGEGNSFSALTLVDSAALATYHCKEDEACYTESVAPDGVVTHELSLTMERMDQASARAVTELVEESLDSGLVAIVRTNNNTSILVGWSQWFQGRYPLRVASAVGQTGRTLSDVSAEVVVLRSTDLDKAWAYTGTV